MQLKLNGIYMYTMSVRKPVMNQIYVRKMFGKR